MTPNAPHETYVEENEVIVIAKGYADRPYVRAVVRQLGDTFILANPDCSDSVRSMLAEGVGFPATCVFSFDAGLRDSLECAWRNGDRTKLMEAWNEACPFRNRSAS